MRVLESFRGAREMDAIVYGGFGGIFKVNTMEGFLWREVVGRGLVSHDAAELVGGMRR